MVKRNINLNKCASRQRGVALITVLLVFALVAVIATELLHRSQLNLRSVANLVDTRQAYYYALAGEAYARQLLARDVIDGKGEIDNLLEPWAKASEQPPFEIADGEIHIEIHDLQGRFNLNSVIDENGLASPTGFPQFKALLVALQLNNNYANEWLDWIDRDQQRTATGAEDADYAGYRTAGAPEADISALRLLRSMLPQDYAKLAPHIAVLPENNAAINVNTADAAVLRLLSPIISDARAAELVARQKSGGFRTIEEFQQAAGLTQSAAVPIGLNSNYFEVLITVKYANHWQRVRTILRRDRGTQDGPVSFAVLNRVRSPLIDDLE
jgi:general secretion pathway protein K